MQFSIASAADGDAYAGFLRDAASGRVNAYHALCNKEAEFIEIYKTWTVEPIYAHWMQIGKANNDPSTQQIEADHENYQNYQAKMQKLFGSGELCKSAPVSPFKKDEINPPKPYTQEQINSLLASKTTKTNEIKSQAEILAGKLNIENSACEQKRSDYSKAELTITRTRLNFNIWSEAAKAGMSFADAQMKTPSLTSQVSQSEMDAAEKNLKELKDLSDSCIKLVDLLNTQLQDLWNQINKIETASSSVADEENCSKSMQGLEIYIKGQKQLLDHFEKIWSSYNQMKQEVDSNKDRQISQVQYFENLYIKSKFFFSDYSQKLGYFLGEGSSELSIYPLVFCQGVPGASEYFKKDVLLANTYLTKLQLDYRLMDDSYSTFSAAVKASLKASSSALKGNSIVKSIVCSKGKLTKKVSGSNPVCPKGYLKK